MSLIVLLSTANVIQAQTKLIGNYAGIPRANNPASSLEWPLSAGIPDGNGGLYVATLATSQIFRVSSNGDVTVIANQLKQCGGSIGDGGPATAASICNPIALALDAAGNLYVADFNNHRLRKITPAGIISTVAGTGGSGSTGDGGPATSAEITPSGVAVDVAGNIFISDSTHKRIRKVGTNGVITLVAGNGVGGSAGDGGPATSAQLTFPRGLAIDSLGNLFIAEQAASGRIRKVSTNGIISTVAGGGATAGNGVAATSVTLVNPYSVTVDSDGNIFIAETGAHSVRKVGTNGIITNVAGNGTPGSTGDGGAAITAQLYDPINVSLDGFGALIIATDTCVRKVDPSGIISTIAGNGTNGFGGDGGPATLALMDSDIRVAMDSAGNLYFSDYTSQRIRKINSSGIVTTIAGNGTFGSSGDGGPALSAAIGPAFGIAIDNAGNIFFADQFNNRVRRIGVDGIITTVAGTGSAGYNGDGGLATSKLLNAPMGVAVDSSGNLFIADTSNFRLRKVDTNGVISTVAGSGSSLFRPNSVTVANDGTLIIADTQNRRITKIIIDGSSVTTFNVVNQGNIDGDDVPASTARLVDAQDVAVDAFGNLFIADGRGNRVRRVTPGGVITTVAGTGESGYLGQNGPATSAQINYTSGVTVDIAGNVYIVDQKNNSIHKVDFGAVPTFLNSAPLRADFDGDGKMDILWRHNDGRASLWLMNGTGLSSGGQLMNAGTGWVAKQTGDFNGDGKADILWQHTDGSIAVWLMNGSSLSSGGVLLGAGSGWTVKQIADFDGDGKADILWQSTDGSIAVWLMDGLNLKNGNVILNGGTGWGVKTIGDFNGDHKADIVWQHVDGTTSIWLMDGLNLIDGGGLIGAGSGWSVKAIGDFNGDGKSDIVWQHTDGSLAAWLMNGLNLIDGAGWLGTGNGWTVGQVGDLNGDSKADIVWQNADGRSAAWLMDGLTMTAGGGLLSAGTGWSSRAISDLNGDGKSDIIWQNTDGSTAVWLMDGLNLTTGAVLLGSGSGWSSVP